MTNKQTTNKQQQIKKFFIENGLIDYDTFNKNKELKQGLKQIIINILDSTLKFSDKPETTLVIQNKDIKTLTNLILPHISEHSKNNIQKLSNNKKHYYFTIALTSSLKLKHTRTYFSKKDNVTEYELNTTCSPYQLLKDLNNIFADITTFKFINDKLTF